MGTPFHLGHMDRVAATMPSQAHAGAAQEAPDIGQWEGQDVPLVRPSSCFVKGGIASSRRYLPTYLRLYPATSGWGVWCGCVCSGSGLGCALPLLAGLLGCVCGCALAPLVPRHFWLGCAVGVFAWARVSAAPRHSWLGCWGVCVFVCPLCLYLATPGWAVWSGCVRLGYGLGCAPPLLAGVLGCVCVRVRAPLVPCHSWLGCAVWVCVCGLGFQLRPATPGWGVGVSVRLCARSACTPPLLAGVCVVGVCAWARVSSAPRHTWLGCWGVCAFVCTLRLYPATPGWGVWCGCVCLGLGFLLCPATPGWGVAVRVCLCARSGCTPPLLAGVCGVGVCAWARVWAVPRPSWLGCWGVCAFVCALRLYPAIPGWGVRCGCVWLGSGFACWPPLLAGVLGCVCVCVRAPLVPRHSWLECVVWVCVPGLGFWLHPATPGWGVGVRVCSCVRSACTLPLLAEACGVGVCASARVLAAPCHSWLGCWDVCVFLCALCLYPATPGWGVRCWCVCVRSGLGRAPPLLAGVLGCMCVCVRAQLGPCNSWLACAVWLCVPGMGFWLRPATPGWGVGMFVCLCVRSAGTPPLLAGVCGDGVCVLARVWAAPRHSWLGCWGVCVIVCALRLYPATPGWAVWSGCMCFGLGLGCAPPLLAGVLGCVCVCVRAPLVSRHSWLGCAVCVCVPGLGFWLHPATPGWGVGVCVCSCARSACTPPLLAGVCGVGVCA